MDANDVIKDEDLLAKLKKLLAFQPAKYRIMDFIHPIQM
jgi:hypothetical protein